MIGPLLLIRCASALFRLIQFLFSQFLLYGSIPQEWKVLLITPVHKSGDKSSAKNYRPISLLCSLCKILERFVFDHIMSFVAPAISVSQFGFVKGRSTQQQLITMLHGIADNLDNWLASDIAYLDLKKAFDTVSHDILLSKLRSLGINGQIFNWLLNYLTNCTQQVTINGSLSSPLGSYLVYPRQHYRSFYVFTIFQ
uniref:Reverse transcriptase domain-containing protein n=1 Tax=Amphimedon queenslandica TaxID=400682 RepID=A0A1X7VU98_AMPQE